MTTCTRESGTCSTCVAACYRKPGWFIPGEVERVADHLGVSVEELFRTRLGVDWHDDHPSRRDVFVLAPATTTMTPGEEYPGDPTGRCVFLTDDDRCGIHEVKPYECREYWCDAPDVNRLHLAAADAWVEHQQQIRDLLGDEPYAAPYDGGLLGMLDW
jgi:Fe-S-cluster containining protein